MTTTVVNQAKGTCAEKEEDMSSYVEGQVHQLMERLEKAGFLAKHLTLLGQYKDLGSIRDVLEGHSEIRPKEYLIDLDAYPFIPSKHWEVVEHKKGGQWKYDPAKLGLYLSQKQEDGTIMGHDLRKELEGQPVMNANLLDFYLKNPLLIPSAWKSEAIFFWGTVYRNAAGSLYVRFLYRHGCRWDDNFRCLRNGWHNRGYTVVLVK